MEAWNEAIAAYGSIVRNHPEHNLAPDSQYKLGQCHEEAGELDEALEAYVTLAGTYPKSPLIANVMLRINEHFYTKEDYSVAASVGEKFLEKFPNHEWTPKMAFRIGQCLLQAGRISKRGQIIRRLY
jgi:TolA-binding protein